MPCLWPSLWLALQPALTPLRDVAVISTAQEPVAGWINNVYGPTGVVTGAGLGLIHVLQCDSDRMADMVPVDMAINSIVAAAWDVAKGFDENKEVGAAARWPQPCLRPSQVFSDPDLVADTGWRGERPRAGGAQLRVVRGPAHHMGGVHGTQRARDGGALRALRVVLRIPAYQEPVPVHVPNGPDAPAARSSRGYRLPPRRQKALVSSAFFKHCVVFVM